MENFVIFIRRPFWIPLCDLTRRLSGGQPIFSWSGDIYVPSESVKTWSQGGTTKMSLWDFGSESISANSSRQILFKQLLSINPQFLNLDNTDHFLYIQSSADSDACNIFSEHCYKTVQALVIYSNFSKI